MLPGGTSSGPIPGVLVGVHSVCHLTRIPSLSPLLALLAFRCRDKLEITLSRARGLVAGLRLIDFFDERDSHRAVAVVAPLYHFRTKPHDRDRENRDARGDARAPREEEEETKPRDEVSAFLAPDLARRWLRHT